MTYPVQVRYTEQSEHASCPQIVRRNASGTIELSVRKARSQNYISTMAKGNAVMLSYSFYLLFLICCSLPSSVLSSINEFNRRQIASEEEAIEIHRVSFAFVVLHISTSRDCFPSAVFRFPVFSRLGSTIIL